MPERVWTAGINGAILCNGKRWAYIEDDGAGFAYAEDKLAQIVVDALNEKEQREAGSAIWGIIGLTHPQIRRQNEAHCERDTHELHVYARRVCP